MKYLVFIALSSTILIACSSEESTPNNAPPVETPNVGIFLDAPVSGISYETLSYSGVTDDMGRFNYNAGENVQFSIGDIILPATPANDIVHVSEIFNSDINDQKVINLARLLITLDEDQNLENGISISAMAIAQALGANIDFASVTFETDIVNYVANAGGAVALIPENDAISHIQETQTEANNYTNAVQDALFYGCEITTDTNAIRVCAQRANFNDHVANFSPRHQQINVSVNAKIKVSVISDNGTGTGEFNVELFPIKIDADRCRIDQGGFVCGDDTTFDTQSAFANVINGLEFLNGTANVANPIIFGTANIDADNNVEFTPERILDSGVTYVVHIFANPGFTEFKTWWIFKT